MCGGRVETREVVCGLHFAKDLLIILYATFFLVKYSFKLSIFCSCQIYSKRARTTRLGFVLSIFVCVVVFLVFLRLSGDMGLARNMQLLLISAVAELFAFAFVLCYFLTMLPNFNKTRLYIFLVERVTASIMEPFRVDEFLTADSGSLSRRKRDGNRHMGSSRISSDLSIVDLDILSENERKPIPRFRHLLRSGSQKFKSS